MKWLNALIKKLRDISSAYGYTCDGCGVEIFNYPHRRVCDKCLARLTYNDTFVCEKCGRKTVTTGVCLDCKRVVPAFTRGVSPFAYQGHTSALINRIKNGDRRLCYFFSEKTTKALLEKIPALQQRFGRGMYETNDESILLVPVPLTNEKLAKRGYNQAEDLAFAMEKALDKAGVNAKVDSDVLQKRRSTEAQKQLTLAQRAENVRGAYHVRKRTACKGKTLLLIDDIMTTGATGSECARLLLGAGAKEVYFVTVASLSEMKNDDQNQTKR